MRFYLKPSLETVKFNFSFLKTQGSVPLDCQGTFPLSCPNLGGQLAFAACEGSDVEVSLFLPGVNCADGVLNNCTVSAINGQPIVANCIAEDPENCGTDGCAVEEFECEILSGPSCSNGAVITISCPGFATCDAVASNT
jgi:hypothetical protein